MQPSRRTSLVIVIPALLLFSFVLLGTALFFAANFDQPTTAARWLASAASLLLSIAIVSALFREFVLRFAERRGHGPSDHASGRLTEWDHVASPWRFTPRWKEELACASADGELILEMIMHEPHVYFPTDEAWARQAPGWAKNRRGELLAQLEQWCIAQGILFTVDERAWVAVR